MCFQKSWVFPSHPQSATGHLIFIQSLSHSHVGAVEYVTVILSPEKTKWTNIAVGYVNQIKSQSNMGQHKSKKLSPDGSDKIEMRNGKIMMNGQEYTPEEFQKIMPGIRVPQDSHPHLVRDITGELRIDGMTVEEYRKMHAEQRVRRTK